MKKLRITLTDEEGALLAEQAMLLGYDVTKYAKFVLAQKAIEQLSVIPTYKATPMSYRPSTGFSSDIVGPLYQALLCG